MYIFGYPVVENSGNKDGWSMTLDDWHKWLPENKQKGITHMKTVTINGVDFEVREESRFLSIAETVPEKIGDIVSCNVYDLRINPPQWIIKSDMVADAEYIAMMEEIKAGDKYYSILQGKE